MKKALKIIALLCLVCLFLLAGAAVALHFYLSSDGFRNMLLDKTGEALGVKITTEKFEFSYWKGARMVGVKVRNPDGMMTPHFFEAESFSFQYNLLALLRRKIEIERFTLKEPKLTMEQTKDGTWYLPGQKSVPTGPVPETGAPTPATVPSKPLPFSVETLQIINGSFVMLGQDGRVPFSVRGLNLKSTINIDDTINHIAGAVSFNELTVTDKLTISAAQSDFELQGRKAILRKLQGQSFGGRVEGQATIDLGGVEMPLFLELQGRGLDLQQILEKFGSGGQQITGALQAAVKLQIPLNAPLELSGGGAAELANGRVVGNPLLQLIGSVFNISEFQEVPFQKARTDFSITNRVVTLTGTDLKSPDIRLFGGGTITFERVYDVVLTLTMSERLMNLLANDVKIAFKRNEDGTYATPEFKVYGPQSELKQNLLDTLLKDGGKRILEKKAGELLNNLFKRKEPAPPAVEPPAVNSPAAP
ncbi:MAG: AsmA family protein [Verrucomicrobiae bacterium]|nr:AsmA family protein [Verrucomicrobiae bacterium]